MKITLTDYLWLSSSSWIYHEIGSIIFTPSHFFFLFTWLLPFIHHVITCKSWTFFPSPSWSSIIIHSVFILLSCYNQSHESHWNEWNITWLFLLLVSHCRYYYFFFFSISFIIIIQTIINYNKNNNNANINGWDTLLIIHRTCFSMFWLQCWLSLFFVSIFWSIDCCCHNMKISSGLFTFFKLLWLFVVGFSYCVMMDKKW